MAQIKSPAYITFVTLSGSSLYAFLNPDKTTTGHLLNTFHDNYECKDIKREDLKFYLPNSHQITQTDDLKKLKIEKILVKGPHDFEPDDETFNDTTLYNQIDSSPEAYTVTCTSLMGSSKAVTIAPNLSGLEIKHLVNRAHKNNLEYDQFKLISDGKVITNHEIYNIKPNSNMILVYNYRGGMYHETSGKNGNYEPLKQNYFIVKPDK